MSLSVPAPTRGNFLDTSAHRTPLHQSRDRFRRLRHTIHPAGHLDLGLRRAGPIRRSGPSRGLAAVLPEAARWGPDAAGVEPAGRRETPARRTDRVRDAATARGPVVPPAEFAAGACDCRRHPAERGDPGLSVRVPGLGGRGSCRAGGPEKRLGRSLALPTTNLGKTLEAGRHFLSESSRPLPAPPRTRSPALFPRYRLA